MVGVSVGLGSSRLVLVIFLNVSRGSILFTFLYISFTGGPEVVHDECSCLTLIRFRIHYRFRVTFLSLGFRLFYSVVNKKTYPGFSRSEFHVLCLCIRLDSQSVVCVHSVGKFGFVLVIFLNVSRGSILFTFLYISFA